MKRLKKNKLFNLHTKTVNTIMINGKKRIGEKILLKLAKRVQKLASKNFKNLIQIAIVNSTPAFKLKEQVVKKGKRKSIKISPSFILKDSLRIMASLKFIRDAALKINNSTFFYERLAKEILDASSQKGMAVVRKNDSQKDALVNKRYLSKFRW